MSIRRKGKKKSTGKQMVWRSMPVSYYVGDLMGYWPKWEHIDRNMIPYYTPHNKHNDKKEGVVFPLHYSKIEALLPLIEALNSKKGVITLAVKYMRISRNAWLEYQEDWEEAIDIIYELGGEHLNPDADPAINSEAKEPEPLVDSIKIKELNITGRQKYEEMPRYKMLHFAKRDEISGYREMEDDTLRKKLIEVQDLQFKLLETKK